MTSQDQDRTAFRRRAVARRAALEVIVQGDRVIQVGESGAKGCRKGMREIDASSLTLLPGLIDAHFHPVSGSFDVASLDRSHPSLRALDAADIWSRRCCGDSPRYVTRAGATSAWCAPLSWD